MEFNESLKCSYIFIDMWGYIHIMIFKYNYKISKYDHVFITIYIVNIYLYFGHDAPTMLILSLVGASLLNILPHVASDFAKWLEEGWPLVQAVALPWWVFSPQYHTLQLVHCIF